MGYFEDARSYFEDARIRAKRRRSGWNLLLIPAVVGPWMALWYGGAMAFGQLVRRLRPELRFVLLPDGFGGIFIAIGLFVAASPIAMILGNLLIAAIPAARRVLEGEAMTVPGTDLASANRKLRQAARFITPAGLLLALLGLVIA